MIVNLLFEIGELENQT